MTRQHGPVGYFVHHQGRGHAERSAAIANALAPTRSVMLFCARDDIFPELADGVECRVIPSLFEELQASPPALAELETPDTLHCAPVGWHQITAAIAQIVRWFDETRPSLFVTDVSAELAQLARIASVPHMAVLQHGMRDDPGHLAAYRGAAALLAPYDSALDQPNEPGWKRAKTIHAPGLGVDTAKLSDKAAARRRLGLADNREYIVVVGGGGGRGLPSAPLTLGARAEPDTQWVTLGKVESEWHETPPANLTHLGWVENAEDWISAADRIVSSAGNTTVHLVAAAAKPWIVVPEWRYFGEQVCKAEALDRVGAAAHARVWPSSAHEWAGYWRAASGIEPESQRRLISEGADRKVASEIEELIARLWSQHSPASAISVESGAATA